MVRGSILVVLVSGLLAGCALDASSEGDGSIDPSDVKPADGAELEGNSLGSSQEAHALHYTDGTNQWKETSYPMGTDNPNCKDWWVYDNYLSVVPAVGYTNYSTYQTKHSFAKGSYVDMMMSAIPDSLGYSWAWKTILIDYNSVVARSSGKCSGRYVFQWDNRPAGGEFLSNAYWVTANIPSYLIPANAAACNTTAGESVPSALVDLYVCEAPKSTAISSVSGWCSKSAGNWRKAGSSSSAGYWNSYWKRCDVATGVYYLAPSSKKAISFNMVVKTGIGHGVAPAEIQVYRYY